MEDILNRNGNTLKSLAAILSCIFLLAPVAFAQSAKPVNLKCESLSTPLGMDSAKPLLSWQIRDSRLSARQTAYRIQVASTEHILAGSKGDIWDSGRVESDNSRAVPYAGPALEPSKRYYWRVSVWDQDGVESAPSESSWWETGLLRQENWKAKWRAGFRSA